MAAARGVEHFNAGAVASIACLQPGTGHLARWRELENIEVKLVFNAPLTLDHPALLHAGLELRSWLRGARAIARRRLSATAVQPSPFVAGRPVAPRGAGTTEGRFPRGTG